MDFFVPIVALGTNVQWTLTFMISPEGYIKGSYSLHSKDIKNTVLQQITPLRFKGTAVELDNELLPAIKKPVIEHIGMIENLRSHEATVATAKKKAEEDRKKTGIKTVTTSAAKTDPKPSPKTPEKDPHTKKFEAQWNKALELERQSKPGQALSALPKIENFPERKQQILEKAAFLRSQRNDLDLFNSETPPESNPGIPLVEPVELSLDQKEPRETESPEGRVKGIEIEMEEGQEGAYEENDEDREDGNDEDRDPENDTFIFENENE